MEVPSFFSWWSPAAKNSTRLTVEFDLNHSHPPLSFNFLNLDLILTPTGNLFFPLPRCLHRSGQITSMRCSSKPLPLKQISFIIDLAIVLTPLSLLPAPPSRWYRLTVAACILNNDIVILSRSLTITFATQCDRLNATALTSSLSYQTTMTRSHPSTQQHTIHNPQINITQHNSSKHIYSPTENNNTMVGTKHLKPLTLYSRWHWFQSPTHLPVSDTIRDWKMLAHLYLSIYSSVGLECWVSRQSLEMKHEMKIKCKVEEMSSQISILQGGEERNTEWQRGRKKHRVAEGKKEAQSSSGSKSCMRLAQTSIAFVQQQKAQMKIHQANNVTIIGVTVFFWGKIWLDGLSWGNWVSDTDSGVKTKRKISPFGLMAKRRIATPVKKFISNSMANSMARSTLFYPNRQDVLRFPKFFTPTVEKVQSCLFHCVHLCLNSFTINSQKNHNGFLKNLSGRWSSQVCAISPFWITLSGVHSEKQHSFLAPHFKGQFLCFTPFD
ncbi:hypothetical protein VP01_377g2 [Puccinia sorghi]|uniref:Uncharacterized protein n=1 Tax=Puccinia sorghi TaxID=27349 RepID=A0A0L6UTR6_9BASI|nr:hypothetical protein VP01_377g2 [Puccinia sorghi]